MAFFHRRGIARHPGEKLVFPCANKALCSLSLKNIFAVRCCHRSLNQLARLLASSRGASSVWFRTGVISTTTVVVVAVVVAVVVVVVVCLVLVVVTTRISSLGF